MGIEYLTAIDDLGRVRIPKDIRKALEITEFDSLDITVEGNKVCFAKSDSKENMAKKDLVYVCSPLHADTENEMKTNMLKACEYVRDISEKCNCRAIAPHSFLPNYINDNILEERKLGLKFGRDLLKLCKKLYVCGDVISEGMQKEIEFAMNFGVPVVKWDK